MRKLTGMIVVAVVVMTVGVCHAQDRLRDRNDWNFTLGLQGWLGAARGDVGPKDNPYSVDQNSEELADDLSLAGLLSFDFNNGRWGLFTEVSYVKQEDDEDESTELITHDIEQFVAMMAPYFRVTSNRRLSLDLGLGARYMDTKISLTSPAESASRSRGWVDPLVLARANLNIFDWMYLGVAGDIGGFEMASDLTWQLVGTLGFSIGDHFGIQLGYRHLYVDYEDGPFVYDMGMGGATVGMTFSW